MSPAFFPFPFPVETPLGQGYAIYVTPAPMFENDCWCVALDDGRILHFSSNQLRYPGNGTYDMNKPEAPPMRHALVIKRDAKGDEYPEHACGARMDEIHAVLGEEVTCLPCLRYQLQQNFK